MQEEKFRAWLIIDRRLTPRYVLNAVARCRRIERHEGDLDARYNRDQLIGLLKRLKPGRPKHKVPINGNIYAGTAALQSAVHLYRDFRDARAGVYVTERPQAKWRRQKPGNERPGAGVPVWGTMVDRGLFRFAQKVTPYVQFLHPGIIRALVQDNRLMRPDWSCRLQALGIDSEVYLWDGSTCAFPGVRPRAGSTRPAAFPQQAAAGKSPRQWLAFGDRHYPKHLWSFVFAGEPFRRPGPPSYRIAHFVASNEYADLWVGELDILPGARKLHLPYGLFTSAACSAYVPSGYRGSVESSPILRQLIQRRALQLYGDICRIVPPPVVVRACQDPNWSLENFLWSEPVGDMCHVPDFLEFRRQHMETLFAKRHAASHAEANR